MARLHADENFSHRVVDELRLLGHDVQTARDAGQANQGIGDAAVLAYAVADKRAVLTFNRLHFRRLHQHNRPHCGIISCKRGDKDDPVDLAKRIDQAIAGLASLNDQLIRVYRLSKP